MSSIRVQIVNGNTVDVEAGTEVGTLAPSPFNPDGLPWIAALVNNDAASLTYPLTTNASVRFIAMDDPHGWRIYRRSLAFLLARAVRDTFPSARFSLEHSFGLGLYCTCAVNTSKGITVSQVSQIEERMRELVRRDIPILRRKISYDDAANAFENAGQLDRLMLLKHRNPPRIVVHHCGDYSDLAHGPLAASTGALERFQLIPYPPGFVLHLPDRDAPTHIPPFEDQPHLFRIFQEHKEWGRILGVTTAGQLNERIANGGFEELVRIAEALHENKVVRIADAISAGRSRIKLVLIAGPSSAGKTTLAKRLATQLTVNGLRTVTLSTDDYFVGDTRNPKGPDGKPDYEHIEAIDLPLFNEHLLRLIRGQEVRLPRFNFETKQREDRGITTRLAEDQLIVIEGIHALNPLLTGMVDRSAKFSIYVSALTQLSVDSGNRVSTTDNRLMRRIVRDHKYRGSSALDTLRLWNSVRSGEKRWIFPFQKEADATFNSALDYELAVLKPSVEPLLMSVKPTHPEYVEARRLSEFLINFLPAPSRIVPGTSILREYIGGSLFHY